MRAHSAGFLCNFPRLCRAVSHQSPHYHWQLNFREILTKISFAADNFLEQVERCQEGQKPDSAAETKCSLRNASNVLKKPPIFRRFQA
jgi:hypothetical protein